MAGFLEEIKRRKVYRVAAGYVVVAGGLIQLASAVFPAWELPNWALRLVIILLLIGFPISLILAWALEVTPEGIRPTPTAPSAPRRRRNIVALVAIGVIVSAAAGFFLLPRASARKIDKSIAVLPFENFSDDKENAYFADGIQDDILTNLSKIGDLKVISRTSVMPYRGKEKNVKEIAQALGVSAVLEGSVRKSGNRVRVNVQLINAVNDEHIWSDVYDRDLTDVFAIQTDLAKKIADELHAKLSPSEKEQITRKPTENGEAYLAFVQAHNIGRELDDLPKLRQAVQLYERALQLDPNFALAAAIYSRLESWIYHTYEPTPERREKMRSLANRALQLQPDLPEAHLALGFSFYYGDRDYDRALAEFAVAQKGLPNDAEAFLAIGAIQRRQGKWDTSNANLEKAVSLSPNETWPLQNLALNYQMLRRWDAANRTLDRALKLTPDSFPLWSIRAQSEIAEKGTFETVERGAQMLAARPVSEDMQMHFNVALAQTRLLQRQYAEAVRVIETIKDEAFANDPENLMGKYGALGIAKKLLGDDAGAREALLKTKGYAEKYLAAAPDESKRHDALAEALAWLGEKEAAIAGAKRAMALLPESIDAFEGPVCTQKLAEIYMIVGDHDLALPIVDGLLSRPSPLTVAILKLNPLWDPVRQDPRFIAILRKHGG
jgi:TolB-like protein/cytochrome c-type biogenesis protein CcmH/NrfG